jgi:AAA+ ATPase superfamily predicted ATPase
LRIAVVYGRRRQGKSYLLRRLTGAVGGLYHLATDELRAEATASRGKILLASLDELYGQPS